MGCAASLTQVGSVEDPQRITQPNPSPALPCNEIKSSPAKLENYYIPKSRNLSDSSEIAQILCVGSGVRENLLNISMSPPPFLATPDGPLLPELGVPFQKSVDPESARSPNYYAGETPNVTDEQVF